VPNRCSALAISQPSRTWGQVGATIVMGISMLTRRRAVYKGSFDSFSENGESYQPLIQFINTHHQKTFYNSKTKIRNGYS
jgi:hypothetical protein